jgi:hypothetical protein
MTKKNQIFIDSNPDDCKKRFSHIWTDEGKPPTIPSLLSRDYVHHVVPNELWIPWKEFGLIAYCWWDIAFLRYFLIEGCGPPQEHEENWFSNFDLKLCTEIGTNGNNSQQYFLCAKYIIFLHISLMIDKQVWTGIKERKKKKIIQYFC